MKKLVRKKTFGHASIYLTAIFFLSIFIGVGYAYLNSSLAITGNTTIEKASWDVHFENLTQTGGSITSNSSTIENNSTLINFDITLENPGDYYEFNVDVVNKGTIDAMVSSLVNTGLTTEQQKYLTYIVSYSDGTEIIDKQLLKSGNKETIKVYIKYRDDVESTDLPGEDQNLELQLNISYVQADDSAIAVAHPVCKRATTLHTEICNQTDTIYYCSAGGYSTGDTITYGNLGTSGVLTSGDAFDCDVNKDGVYDSETERFYYISDLDTNSNYAVLSYYSNVDSGVASGTLDVKYNNDISGSGDTTFRGPQVAMLELPTISQWSNVSLSSTERDITDTNGTVVGTKFSYEGYAARLLTSQEVQSACNTSIEIMNSSTNKGQLDSCKYLMENTSYATSGYSSGSWLETVRSGSSGVPIYIESQNRYVYPYIGIPSNGTRPAIEVAKSQISY